ncbi:MAG: bifunctional 3-deoxy-7-phosphoheptulonate synthase/chorismate mutase type II [Flavobacteriales bacterium]|nr:bifunctional 3-deoxy-7-phosphoheptulonate synthase/chorismate mutase type II [Flavobacteriales bacterium]
MVQESFTLIAGPCSAESREQVLAAASGLKEAGLSYFRSGIWKPRTRPGAFEGVGHTGLPWLQEVQAKFGMKVCVEVAQPRHVEAALEAGIDMLWIGARTTANPFQVQEMADCLRGVDVPVAVKNPTQPDLALWSGAFERLAGAGIRQLSAVHRGFTVHGQKKYRNVPLWQIPIDFRSGHPEIPLLNDPSHITGKRGMVPDVAQMAMDLGFDGLMVEVHPDPDSAWTDAAQQVTPARFLDIIKGLETRVQGNGKGREDLSSLRAEIDMIDEGIVDLLARRMGISEEIGRYKRANGMTILQIARWNQILKQSKTSAVEQGLNPGFVEEVFKAIHQASISTQRMTLTDQED